jgi:hypothetical protein
MFSFGLPQFKVLVAERAPTVVPCRALLERGATVRWVTVSGCDVHWSRARRIQESRWEGAVYVPASIVDVSAPAHALYIRVSPGAVGEGRSAWTGMLDIRATEAAPDFARDPSVRILYTNRPSGVELAVALAAPLVYVGALARTLGRRSRRRAAARHLQGRYPAGREAGTSVVLVDVDVVLRARRAAQWSVPLLAGAAATMLSVVVLDLLERSAAAVGAVAAAGAGLAAWGGVHWRRAALQDRLVYSGRAAVVLAPAVWVLSYAFAASPANALTIALPLTVLSSWCAFAAFKSLRRFGAAPDAELLRSLDVAAVESSRARVARYRSVRRRPVRVVAYRCASVATALLGLLLVLVARSLLPFSIALGVAFVLWIRGTRHASFSAREVMERDFRPPVLLLRSFGDDDVEPEANWRLQWLQPATLPFVAAERLSAHGPVLAIAQPGETLPPLGPYRVFVEDRDWRAEVDALIAGARLVVLVLGHSQGVLWEFKRLLEGRSTARVLLLVPPVGPADLERRWEALIGSTRGHPPWSAVRHVDPLSALVITPTKDRLLVFRSRTTSLAAYDWALRASGAWTMASSDGDEPMQPAESLSRLDTSRSR